MLDPLQARIRSGFIVAAGLAGCLVVQSMAVRAQDPATPPPPAQTTAPAATPTPPQIPAPPQVPAGEKPAAAPSKPDAPVKEGGGFTEARQGDVPEGAAEQVTPETDRAIELGLAWLAKSQNGDGSFGSGGYRGNIAVTSLAGLAFMANGSSPGRGPYGSQIDKALVYVMNNTAPSGFIAVPNAGTHGPMYSHGFGALFLAEAYGMSRRPELREKLTNAIRLIIDTQNAEGRLALSAGPQRRRYLGDDLPDQRPPRRAERRPVRPQGDGRQLHPVRQADPERRRRLPLHDPARRQRFPPVGGRRGRPLQRLGL